MNWTYHNFQTLTHSWREHQSQTLGACRRPNLGPMSETIHKTKRANTEQDCFSTFSLDKMAMLHFVVTTLSIFCWSPPPPVSAPKTSPPPLTINVWVITSVVSANKYSSCGLKFMLIWEKSLEQVEYKIQTTHIVPLWWVQDHTNAELYSSPAPNTVSLYIPGYSHKQVNFKPIYCSPIWVQLT